MTVFTVDEIIEAVEAQIMGDPVDFEIEKIEAAVELLKERKTGKWEEEVMEKATDLLRRNQQDFTTDASHADLVYTVAYNDGVMDLMTELIKEIEA